MANETLTTDVAEETVSQPSSSSLVNADSTIPAETEKNLDSFLQTTKVASNTINVSASPLGSDPKISTLGSTGGIKLGAWSPPSTPTALSVNEVLEENVVAAAPTPNAQNPAVPNIDTSKDTDKAKPSPVFAKVTDTSLGQTVTSEGKSIHARLHARANGYKEQKAGIEQNYSTQYASLAKSLEKIANDKAVLSEQLEESRSFWNLGRGNSNLRDMHKATQKLEEATAKHIDALVSQKEKETRSLERKEKVFGAAAYGVGLAAGVNVKIKDAINKLHDAGVKELNKKDGLVSDIIDAGKATVDGIESVGKVAKAGIEQKVSEVKIGANITADSFKAAQAAKLAEIAKEKKHDGPYGVRLGINGGIDGETREASAIDKAKAAASGAIAALNTAIGRDTNNVDKPFTTLNLKSVGYLGNTDKVSAPSNTPNAKPSGRGEPAIG